jgi:shikimate dehydrogenase
VLQFVDELSDEVRKIGATNSIKISGNKLVAYNTDIIGFEQSFSKLLQPHHTKALVLGTGGASKAVQYVLDKMGIHCLVVTRKDVSKGALLQYEAIDQAIMSAYSIIINCTPVGMSPNENDAPPIPYHLLTEGHYLYDLVYKPAKTLFLKKGEQVGAITQNGYDMLLIQAEASWKIWNDL